MLQYTNTWRPLVFSLSQRSLKFRSKSNERSTSVSSHRNIWDYLRSDYRNLPFRFWQTGSLPCFSYVRNSEKELKLWESDSLWLARFDRKFLGYSHIWSTPHVINAILGHYARFWIFWRILLRLANRGSRLAARGSGSQARKIASPESRSSCACNQNIKEDIFTELEVLTKHKLNLHENIHATRE